MSELTRQELKSLAEVEGKKKLAELREKNRLEANRLLERLLGSGGVLVDSIEKITFGRSSYE